MCADPASPAASHLFEGDDAVGLLIDRSVHRAVSALPYSVELVVGAHLGVSVLVEFGHEAATSGECVRLVVMQGRSACSERKERNRAATNVVGITARSENTIKYHSNVLFRRKVCSLGCEMDAGLPLPTTKTGPT